MSLRVPATVTAIVMRCLDPGLLRLLLHRIFHPTIELREKLMHRRCLLLMFAGRALSIIYLNQIVWSSTARRCSLRLIHSFWGEEILVCRRGRRIIDTESCKGRCSLLLLLTVIRRPLCWLFLVLLVEIGVAGTTQGSRWVPIPHNRLDMIDYLLWLSAHRPQIVGAHQLLLLSCFSASNTMSCGYGPSRVPLMGWGRQWICLVLLAQGLLWSSVALN